MKRFLSIALSLVLFLAPAFAQSADQLLDELEQAKIALANAQEAAAASPDDEALEAEVEEKRLAYDAALEAARERREALKESGESPDDLQELREGILAIHGKFGEDLDAKAAFGLLEKWTAAGKDWLVEEGPSYIVKLVIFILIVLLFRILAGIAGGLTRKTLSTSRLKLSDLLKNFFVGIVSKVVLVAGILIALGQVGVSTGPVLAGVGVVGFVVGFALQDTLGNFAAGIMILMYRPFDVGDYITGGGESGTVKELTLVSTTLTTPDNQKLILPNSSIWGGTIRNVTAQATRRVDFTIGVGYGDDLDKTQKVLAEVAAGHELVLEDPPVQVEVSNLGDSSVDFIVRPWVKTGDYWKVYFDLTKAFKQRLDAEGISIPFPQRDLHLVDVPEKLTVGK